MSTSPLARLGLSSSDEGAANETGSRKAVLGMGGLAVAAVAAAAFLLLGGNADDLGDVGVPPAAAAAAEPAAPSSPQPTPSSAPAPSFPDAAEVRDGRDPFVALYEDPATAGGGTATGAPAPAPDTHDEEPVVPGTAVGEQPAGTGAPEQGASASSLALLRVEGEAAARSAVLTVDGAQQRAAVGESFGPSGSLLLLSLQEGPDAGQWTAVVQVGQGDPFDLVTGVVVPLPAT